MKAEPKRQDPYISPFLTQSWTRRINRAMPPRPSTVTLPAAPPPGVRTVFDFLTRRFSHISPAVWAERFERGKVLSDEGPLGLQAEYRPRLRVRYFREVQREPPVRTDFRIVHEDADLLVVDKPAFLPVTPAGDYVRNCLLSLLGEALGFEGLAPLHRLDKDTSGLVLFSRDPATRSHFSRLFRPESSKHLIKEYWAVCEATRGEFPERMRLESHVARNPQAYLRQAVIPDRPPNAICEVERIGWLPSDESHKMVDSARRAAGADSPPLALVRVTPLTGRKHQIRVQLSHAGLPILNDRLYGRFPRHAPEDLDNPMRLECHKMAILDYPSPDGSRRLNLAWQSRGEVCRQLSGVPVPEG